MKQEDLEHIYQQLVDDFRQESVYQNLINGRLTRMQMNQFIRNLYRTHVRSPKLLAFLYAVSPPDESSASLLHNLLEELGRDDELGRSHPDMLQDLLAGAGLSEEAAALNQAADDDLERYAADPLLFGTLKELGLAVLVEVVAFEFLLSRCAEEWSASLQRHWALSDLNVAWLRHHGVVDVAHAEEGVDNVLRYIAFYGFEAQQVETIIQMSLRDDTFLRRYFLGVVGGAA